MSETIAMDRWVCTCCGYVYDPAAGDPERGVPPGTPFERVPEAWICPVCCALRKAFEKL
jgi:rubredoxin